MVDQTNLAEIRPSVFRFGDKVYPVEKALNDCTERNHNRWEVEQINIGWRGYSPFRSQVSDVISLCKKH